MRRVGSTVLVSLVLVVVLPLLFVQQPTMLESDRQNPPHPWRPNRPMSAAERAAIRAVLDHRWCAQGTSILDLLDKSVMGGGPSWPAGSFAVESAADSGTFSVFVPFRISSVPHLTEVTYVFWYYASTGIVGGGLISAGDGPYRDTRAMDLASALGEGCKA
jgi:hypothetical protein